MEKKWLNLIFIVIGVLIPLILMSKIFRGYEGSMFGFILVVILMIAGAFLFGFGIINYSNMKIWWKIILAILIGGVSYIIYWYNYSIIVLGFPPQLG